MMKQENKQRGGFKAIEFRKQVNEEVQNNVPEIENAFEPESS